MRLQTRLLLSKLVLATVPAAAIAGIILWKTDGAFNRIADQTAEGFKQNTETAKQALVDTAMVDLEHVAKTVHAMCAAQQQQLEIKVSGDLNVARDRLQCAGDLVFSEEKVGWEAVNQYTKQPQRVELRQMAFGETVLEPNADASKPSAVVDEVQTLVGGTCTVFQRMNDAGDMLRVSTNVIKSDGSRAIGTYIPATNPDGTPNPVVSTLLRGETFTGRAYVVDAWYITAYEPIRDAQDRVVGALYVGVKQENNTSLREAIMSISVGQTGYVYVLNGQGRTAGYYVISKGGARDGEDISAAKDANGKLFIKEICERATQLGPGEVDEARYAWKNPSDPEPREKVVKLSYFAPWDWVIGVGAYEDEFYAAANQMDAQSAELMAAARETQQNASRSIMAWCGLAGVGLLFASVLLALFVARSISGPLTRIIAGLNDGADQVNDASEQVSSASQQLAEGASKQASSLEETSSALEQMAAMTRTNAEHSRQANDLATQARENANVGDQTIGRLNEAMSAINESSDQISKIIKVIEEIAFQTNLLALNAAVEAARAGEHGKGFAVVADEVRNLAQRAAAASGDITGLIETSVGRAREGSGVAREVGDVLATIINDVAQVAELQSGITRASDEQAQGIDQINSAVSQMDQLTQQNAAGAEESASAAEELSAQAQMVRGMVEDLMALVSGHRETAAQDAYRSKRAEARAFATAVKSEQAPTRSVYAQTGVFKKHEKESSAQPTKTNQGGVEQELSEF